MEVLLLLPKLGSVTECAEENKFYLERGQDISESMALSCALLLGKREAGTRGRLCEATLELLQHQSTN